jgi:hypothetical protein
MHANKNSTIVISKNPDGSHTTTRMIPFEAVYRQNPPSVLPYMPSVSKVREFDRNLTAHMTILRTLKENLVMSQNDMKQQAKQGHSKCQFSEGDQVFIHLKCTRRLHSNLSSVINWHRNFMVLILFSNVWKQCPIS